MKKGTLLERYIKRIFSHGFENNVRIKGRECKHRETMNTIN